MFFLVFSITFQHFLVFSIFFSNFQHFSVFFDIFSIFFTIFSTVQYLLVFVSNFQYFLVLLSIYSISDTMQYYAIPLSDMTTCGAYPCPVGSIWPFWFSFHHSPNVFSALHFAIVSEDFRGFLEKDLFEMSALISLEQSARLNW